MITEKDKEIIIRCAKKSPRAGSGLQPLILQNNNVMPSTRISKEFTSGIYYLTAGNDSYEFWEKTNSQRLLIKLGEAHPTKIKVLMGSSIPSYIYWLVFKRVICSIRALEESFYLEE